MVARRLGVAVGDLGDLVTISGHRGIVVDQLVDLINAVRRFDQTLTEHENLEGELIERSLHVI